MQQRTLPVAPKHGIIHTVELALVSTRLPFNVIVPIILMVVHPSLMVPREHYFPTTS